MCWFITALPIHQSETHGWTHLLRGCLKCVVNDIHSILDVTVRRSYYEVATFTEVSIQARGGSRAACVRVCWGGGSLTPET